MAYDYSSSTTESVGDTDPTRQLTDLVVDNPMPSVLAAAATGAALMALIAMVARPKSGSISLPKVSLPDVSLPDLSKAKLPKVSIPKVPVPDVTLPKMPDVDFSSLKDLIADAVQRVSDAFPSKRQAKNQLQTAQETVADTVQTTWNTVRDQASDVIDQVQPKIDAATKVARENPIWAALIVGALGTLLGSQLLGKSSSR